MAISDYSTTPADNTSISGITLSDNTAIDAVDNVFRQMMADIATFVQSGMYPIGSLYFSSLSTNPNTTLGFGTWTAFGEGRAIVGVGTSDTASAYAWTAEQKRGLEVHALAAAELAAHSHTFSGSTSVIGAHDHNTRTSTGSFPGGLYATTDADVGGSFNYTTRYTSSAANTALTSINGDHSHIYSGTTSSSGSGTAHNNLQPSIAIYIWKRTA